MSKYSDKTFEKILDDMCRRVKECSTMKGSFIYTALAPFAMELALLYLQLEQDEKNGFADTADYEHLIKLARDRGISPNKATHNHVLYRVTPIFEGDNLVASQIQIEALSFEDKGIGIKMNILLENYQPGIHIDYATGNSYEYSIISSSSILK